MTLSTYILINWPTLRDGYKAYVASFTPCLLEPDPLTAVEWMETEWLIDYFARKGEVAREPTETHLS